MGIIEDDEGPLVSPQKNQTWDKPTIIRRSENAEESTDERVEIHFELINNIKMVRCPFCSIQPFSSQIKLRRHLKSNHPEKKTFIHGSVKSLPAVFVSVETSEPNTDLLTEKRPMPTENSKDMVSVDLINVTTNEPTAVENKKRKHVEDTSTSTSTKLKKSRPLLDPLMHDTVGKRTKKDKEDGSENEDWSEERTEDEDWGEERTDNIDGELEDMFEADDTEGDYCGVCCSLLDPETLRLSAELVDGESLAAVISSVLGLEMTEPHLCEGCDDLSSEISRTKVELLKVQENLKTSISKLRDLYQVGRSILEEDLGEAGLGEELINIRLVADPGPPIRTARYLGFTTGSCYRGRIVPKDELVKDDGSCVEELEIQDEDSCLFLTQEEWASSGITVWNGRVQVPHCLVVGAAVGKHRPRFSFSRGTCQETLDQPFLCLDCEERFQRLSDLMDHSESHEGTKSLNLFSDLECSEKDPLRSQEDEDILPEILFQEQDLVNKFEKIKRDLDDQDARRYKLEFKAFMHREQFKEFFNDVPTLEKPFQCSECNKVFASAQELWGHQVSVGSQTFDCNFGDCREIFMKLPDFAVHYAQHAGHTLHIPPDTAGKKVLNIPCPICGTVVPGLYKLQRHKMRHDPERKYKCPACCKQFVKANTLRKHISNVHRGEKVQKNEFIDCDKPVSPEPLLEGHVVTSHAIFAEYECATCGKLEDSLEKLKQHEIRSHSNIDSVQQQKKCSKCGDDVSEVEYSESSETVPGFGTCLKCKPKKKAWLRSSCPECDVVLKDGSRLSDHFTSSHPGVSARFQCSECELRLLTLPGCRKHYRTMHPGVPLTCLLCKQTFSKEFSLHQHLSSSHQDVIGSPPHPGSTVHCKLCKYTCTTYMEMVIHTRHNHLVESIDMSNLPSIDQVTMVGGHVVEFREDGEQIVALHTIP